jgi:hypothetical protein
MQSMNVNTAFTIPDYKRASDILTMIHCIILQKLVHVCQHQANRLNQAVQILSKPYLLTLSTVNETNLSKAALRIPIRRKHERIFSIKTSGLTL